MSRSGTAAALPRAKLPLRWKQADVAQLVEQSIRNRQVIGSSPIVGSSKFLCFIHLVATLAANTFVCVVNCVVTVFLRTHITL